MANQKQLMAEKKSIGWEQGKHSKTALHLALLMAKGQKKVKMKRL